MANYFTYLSYYIGLRYRWFCDVFRPFDVVLVQRETYCSACFHMLDLLKVLDHDTFLNLLHNLSDPAFTWWCISTPLDGGGGGASDWSDTYCQTGDVKRRNSVNVILLETLFCHIF